MRKILFLVMLCVAVQGCAAQSSYVSTCDLPACSVTAFQTAHEYEEADGLAVVTSPALAFTIQDDVSKVAAQGDILVFGSSEGWRIGATTLTPSTVGFDSAETNMKGFMERVFLKTFSSVEQDNLDKRTLHAVRSFKLSAFGDAAPRYFQRGNLTVYYYSSEKGRYKVYIVDDANENVVTMIDLYGASTSHFAKVISTLKSF